MIECSSNAYLDCKNPENKNAQHCIDYRETCGPTDFQNVVDYSFVHQPSMHHHVKAMVDKVPGESTPTVTASQQNQHYLMEDPQNLQTKIHGQQVSRYDQTPIGHYKIQDAQRFLPKKQELPTTSEFLYIVLIVVCVFIVFMVLMKRRRTLQQRQLEEQNPDDQNV